MIISPPIYGNSYQLLKYYQLLLEGSDPFFSDGPQHTDMCFKYSYRRGKSILLINHCPCVIWIMTNTRSLLFRESIKIICKVDVVKVILSLAGCGMTPSEVIMGRMFWITQFNKSTLRVIISLEIVDSSRSSFQTTLLTRHQAARAQQKLMIFCRNIKTHSCSVGAIKSWS